MSEELKNRLASAEKRIGETRGTLTDIAPEGAMRLGRFPARHFSAADYKIIQAIAAASAKAGEVLTDDDVAVFLVYMLVQIEPEDIVQLWRDAHDLTVFWEKIIAWLATLGTKEPEQMVIDAAPMLQEFRDTAAIVESAEGVVDEGE